MVEIANYWKKSKRVRLINRTKICTHLAIIVRSLRFRCTSARYARNGFRTTSDARQPATPDCVDPEIVVTKRLPAMTEKRPMQCEIYAVNFRARSLRTVAIARNTKRLKRDSARSSRCVSQLTTVHDLLECHITK